MCFTIGSCRDRFIASSRQSECQGMLKRFINPSKVVDGAKDAMNRFLQTLINGDYNRSPLCYVVYMEVCNKMMQQQAVQAKVQPKRFELFFHIIKTFKLLGALLTDRRVSVFRKFTFLGSIAFLLVILFFPDLLNEAFLSTVLPVIGTVLGVPFDAGVDWMAFGLLMVNFLRFFPEDIVSEHYQRIFS